MHPVEQALFARQDDTQGSIMTRVTRCTDSLSLESDPMEAGSQRPDLPIATGDIWTLRRTRLLYVDKTRYIAALVQPKNQFAFLARPRRFGKSLLVSTLEALFQGERALFADT